MASEISRETNLSADRRSLLKWTGALAGATGVGLVTAQAQPPRRPEATTGPPEVGGLRKGMFSYMLAHEQFPIPELVRLVRWRPEQGSRSFPPAIICSHGRPTKGMPDRRG